MLLSDPTHQHYDKIKKTKKTQWTHRGASTFQQYFPDRGDLGCCGDCAQLWIEFCIFFSCVRNIFIQQQHKFWKTCPLQLNSNKTLEPSSESWSLYPAFFISALPSLPRIQTDIPSANWSEITTNLTGSMHFSFLTGTPSRMWCHSREFHLPSHQKSPSYSKWLHEEKEQHLVSWKQKVYSCLKLHNYHKEDFSVQGVVWLESNTKHL